MWKLFILTVIVLSNSHVTQACRIKFSKLDISRNVRGVYERAVFNVTGQLKNCPSSISVRNISVANPAVKRLSILNVTYTIETDSIHIIGFARLLGFAPLTIRLFFRDEAQQRFQRVSMKNDSIGQNACAQSLANRMDILQNCPRLKIEEEHYVLTEEINIAVKRHQTVIDSLFTAVVTFLVTMGTLCIGCDIEMEQLVHNIKRPIPLLIGLFCQIIYLPLLSILISKIFQLDASTSLGLLATASCPGGSSSNIYTALLGGNVDLSVIMTFVSTTLSFGTFPMWIWLFGGNYIDFNRTKFPWWSMFLSLMTVFLPAVVGFLFRRYRPVLAYRIGRFLNPIAVGYLVFILTFGIYINVYIFHVIDLKAIMACCFLPWFGFMGGAILSLVGIRDKKKNIAICIETGIQNTAVAILFLQLTFPHPEADIALANPILVSMAIPVPFLVLAVSKCFLGKFSCFQKFFSPKSEEEALEDGTKMETMEKAIAQELLEEKELEETAQIDKTIV